MGRMVEWTPIKVHVSYTYIVCVCDSVCVLCECLHMHEWVCVVMDSKLSNLATLTDKIPASRTQKHLYMLLYSKVQPVHKYCTSNLWVLSVPT